MNYSVRPALYSDAEAIINVHFRSITKICAKDYTETEISAWAGRKFRPELWCQAMDRDFIWVAEVESLVEGFGHLAIMSEEVGEILGLYLAPEIIGVGAGRDILKVMKDKARREGIKKLHLHATKTAKGFYERCGFFQSASDTTIEMNGVPILCFPMTLEL